ncbi:LysR substrate-binding domain-containing protein [Streptomyces albus]
MLLPWAVLALRRERLGVVVTVFEAAAESQWPRLLDGELDLVVGRLAPTGLLGLRQIPLLSEPVRLVVRAGCPALGCESGGLADLMVYPWALPVPGTALRRELDAALHDAGLGMPREQVECSNGFTVVVLVRYTGMIAVVPDLVAGADRSLARLPLELERARRRVGVTLPGRPLTPCVRLMLEHLCHRAVLVGSAAGCGMPGHDGPEGCAAPGTCCTISASTADGATCGVPGVRCWFRLTGRPGAPARTPGCGLCCFPRAGPGRAGAGVGAGGGVGYAL